MVLFPNCKINLGLRILRRRADGYHDLETVFYPLGLKDVLEVIRTAETKFTAYGIPIPGDAAGNLCIKAWNLLKQDYPQLAPVDIHLYKNIPIGAGLGGGSSNGAFILRLLNDLFQLHLSSQQLQGYAARLGSDCPFFIVNQPALGGGRGEKLDPISLDLSGYSFTIADPGLHISTPQAFSLCTPSDAGPSVMDIIRQPVANWRGRLINDFEGPVFQLYPSLSRIKDFLYEQGAVYASLTGSGSSLFGIFEKGRQPALPENADFKLHYLP